MCGQEGNARGDGKPMEVELLKLLRLIHEEASRAYWRTANDCGSDVSSQCEPCNYYIQCVGQAEIEQELKRLR